MESVTPKQYKITASIVLYKNRATEIQHVIDCVNASMMGITIFLIDNSPDKNLSCLAENKNVQYIHLNKNVGYGTAHNVALRKAISESLYHVVLNPDISFEASIIFKAYEFMQGNARVGLLSPKIIYPDGRLQPMCRMLPTPFDLIARRFIPGVAKGFFRKSLSKYTLTGLDYGKIHNIPNLPGSFMFLRISSIVDVGGFDEHFFMYLEDIDLTRRIHQKYETLYYPEILVKHELGQGSYKVGKLLKYHINSAIYYFNKWGWFNDSERTIINKRLKIKLSNGVS